MRPMTPTRYIYADDHPAIGATREQDQAIRSNGWMVSQRPATAAVLRRGRPERRSRCPPEQCRVDC